MSDMSPGIVLVNDSKAKEAIGNDNQYTQHIFGTAPNIASVTFDPWVFKLTSAPAKRDYPEIAKVIEAAGFSEDYLEYLVRNKEFNDFQETHARAQIDHAFWAADRQRSSCVVRLIILPDWKQDELGRAHCLFRTLFPDAAICDPNGKTIRFKVDEIASLELKRSTLIRLLRAGKKTVPQIAAMSSFELEALVKSNRPSIVHEVLGSVARYADWRRRS